MIQGSVFHIVKHNFQSMKLNFIFKKEITVVLLMLLMHVMYLYNCKFLLFCLFYTFNVNIACFGYYSLVKWYFLKLFADFYM